ncbi:MAG TPA: glycosyltransferase family 4 protein, partial [Armatimonadota bacterium]|nr:glycosyltransferase family 4 protein [Armatimonadota bacterium]
PNGVDPERFSVRTTRSPEPPRVLYLGTLAPWQGVPFLLQALRLVADEHDVSLRVVGGGRREWRKECEHLVRKLELEARVELLPPVSPEAVPALVTESDLCVAPLTVTDRNMTQGCCPIKILEYMAAGRPIAAARLPPVCEVLADEETALLYKPDKPRRLAEVMLRLLSDPVLADRLGREAARVVRERFTWERHNNTVAEVYRGLL